MNKRRHKGTGTLRKLPNGAWYARIRKQGIEVSVTAPTKKEAMERLDQKAKQAGARKWSKTVNEMIDVWLEQGQWAELTRKAYTSKADKHIRPHFGEILLADLDGKMINDVFDKMRQSGYTEKMVKDTYVVLNIICQKAILNGDLDLSPMRQVERPKVEKATPKPLTIKEAKQLLDYAREINDPYLPAWALLLLLGLRSKEARNLKWDDLKDGMAHIRRETTKTAAGARVIPIPPPLQEILDQMDGPRTGYIIKTKFGTQVTPQQLSVMWARRLKEAGLPHRRLHDCRHTCGSMLAANGVPIRVIQAILGHSNEAMTMHYTQQTEDSLKEAMATLEYI